MCPVRCHAYGVGGGAPTLRSYQRWRGKSGTGATRVGAARAWTVRMCRVQVLAGCSVAANECAAGPLAESLVDALRRTDAPPPKRSDRAVTGGAAGAVKHPVDRQNAERVLLEQELSWLARERDEFHSESMRCAVATLGERSA